MTAAGAFLRRLQAWADARLRAAGVPCDTGGHYGAVPEALVRRAVRETPLGEDVTATLERLVDAAVTERSQ